MTEAELLAFQKSVLDDPITQDVWRSKYRHGEESSIAESRARVVGGVYANDDNRAAFIEALELVQRGILIPSGRVNAGAGTGRRVTMNSCYVNETVQDSMPGIARAIGRASLTLQQGGGIGTAWGTVRPAGAIVRRTSSVASGTIPFMRWMNAMAATAASAGDRRGAMMGTLPIDHPDIWNPDQFTLGKDVRGQDILTSPSFLSVKTMPGELTFMNISVLITDAFMKAIEEGAEWDLGFHVPRADGKHVAVYDKPWSYDAFEVDENFLIFDPVFKKGDIAPWYVYRRLPARKLWDEILRTTYKYAEPGVMFIDRINARNNLYYCEDITTTNPCFTGDTKVWTIDGPKRFDELAVKGRYRSGKAVQVLTELPDGKLAYREMTRPRMTQRKAKLVEVTFTAKRGMGGRKTSITTLRCTSTHEFYLASGERRRAADLRPGDRIESAYRRMANQKGYIGLRATNGDKVMEHHLTVELDHGHRPSYPAEHGHHVNEVKGDNSRGNIEIKPAGVHNAERMTGARNPMNAWYPNATEEERARYHDNMSAATSGARNGMAGKRHSPETLAKIGAKTRERFTDPAFRGRHLDGLRRSGTNHTVVSVFELTVTEDVYCGTVKETGRFFVSLGDDHYEGVLVSNCGEQPLPPNNVCCLGSVNLAFLVGKPFTPQARIDYNLYYRAIKAGVRFLDNVLDVTNYPLEVQRAASMNVRRIGLGITGFGDALVQMGIRYGSKESVDLARHLSCVLREVSYTASMELAKERGAFPAFDRGNFVTGYNVNELPTSLKYEISRHGIRNGVLNTIAPNGTISLYVGNVSSGHEPVFSFRPSSRKVRQPDDTVKDYEVAPYSLRLWRYIAASGGGYFNRNTDEYMVGAMDLTPEEHLVVHGAWQEHIDASVSKTINCPSSMTFEDFKGVYSRAYELGAKGATTYRPDPESGRGSVLSEAMPEKGGEDPLPPIPGHPPDIASLVSEASSDAPGSPETPVSDDSDGAGPPPRPGILDGRTYKVKWPVDGVNWYITVTNDGRRVREIFIAGGDPEAREWVEALARTTTAVLRRDGDVRFLVDELERVTSAKGGAFIEKRFRPSIVAAIGGVLREEIERLAERARLVRRAEIFAGTKGIDISTGGPRTGPFAVDLPAGSFDIARGAAEICRKCGSASWVREAGCQRCLSCGEEVCG